MASTISERMGLVDGNFLKAALEASIGQPGAITPEMRDHHSIKYKERPPALKGITNANMFNKLLDTTVMNTGDVRSRFHSAPKEQILQMLEFQSTRNSLYHSLLSFIQTLSDVDLQGSFAKIFTTLGKSLNAKYFSVYGYNTKKREYYLIATNWEKGDAIGKGLAEDSIIHVPELNKTKEPQHTYSFKKSDHYTEVIAGRYPNDLECVLSIPISDADSDRVEILEIVNRAAGYTGSPYFGAEEEFVFKSFASIVGYSIKAAKIIQELEDTEMAMERTIRAFDLLSASDLDPKEAVKNAMSTLQVLVQADRLNYYAAEVGKNELSSVCATAKINYPVFANAGIIGSD